MGEYWEQTSAMFSALFEKPKMAPKLLQKPPFKYIFDIIKETQKQTNFAPNLYSEEEQDSEYYTDKDRKIHYLRKVQELVQVVLKTEIPSKPQKIVSGLEPENTNLLLQAIYTVAVSGEDTAAISKKVASKLDKQLAAGGQEEAAEQPKEETKKKGKGKPEEAKAEPKPEPKPKKEDPKKDPVVEKPKESKQLPQQPKEQPPQQQTQQRPERPDSAPRRPKPKVSSQEDQKKQQQQQQQPEEDELEQQRLQAQQEQENFKKIDTKQYGKFVNEAMKDENELIERKAPEKAPIQDQEPEKAQPKMRIAGKQKITNNQQASDQPKTSQTPGGALDIEALSKIVQSICQNANPLGKSLEFIQDDIESMNQEMDYWSKQYKQSREKMTHELKITEEALQPLMDKIAEIDEQIKDQKAKIQNNKAQIIKNQGTIQSLVYSVVTTK